MTARFSPLTLGAMAVALGASCYSGDPCFTPPSKVEDLRVLAISVEPPNPAADLATGAVERVRLRALIAHAGGSGGSFSVSWAICVLGPEPACPATAAVATDREWTRDSSIEFQVPIALVVAARDADPLRGFAGIRVLATLRVEGARPVAASTPIIFAWRAGEARNHAPALAGLLAARAGDPLTYDVFPLEILGRTPHALRPVLTPGSLEAYDTTDFTGKPVH